MGMMMMKDSMYWRLKGSVAACEPAENYEQGNGERQSTSATHGSYSAEWAGHFTRVDQARDTSLRSARRVASARSLRP
ncbi:hypothetical protein CBOM_07510 [Ceraceosorus bombacis]|uniref:Uncharacterized protein n=1 Tax=Ceraceosorus bombacis TaxID=401625 RepID=A0A0P1BDE3_9BASI|nr:hypothetical protein CBOM_07510 [Ceraceosorus bombacis]